MAVQTPDTKDEQDSAYNPGDIHAAEQFGAYTNAGTDQAESFANDPKNATSNANAVKDREENPDNLNYTGSGSSGKKQNFKFSSLKKKGPMAVIIGLLIGGIGGVSMFLTPGIAVVHLKEIMTQDLNDQLGAMDIRTTHVFKAKFKELDKPLSACAIKIRCGFQGMSKRQLTRFKAAGIDVKTVGERNVLTGRIGVESLSFRDSAGKLITIDKSRDINKLLGDRVVRSAFNKAFNPKFAGFYDAVSAKVFGKFRTSKAKKLTGAGDKEKDASVRDNVAGTSTLEDSRVSTQNKDGTTNQANINANDETAKLENGVKNVEPGKGVNGVFASAKGSALKGVLITGAADSACSVANAARAVSASAKIIRAAQLARFAMIFLNFADQVKAGTATADQATYVGNKLTAVDTDKKIINENSPNDNGVSKEVDNPDYGKSAFDSDGFKTAAYNDAPRLSARSQQFTVGGGLVGSLSGILDKLPGKSSCRFIQNGFVRAGSLAIGVFASAFTFGVEFYAQAAASIGIGLALPLLQSYLADMIGGQVVGPSTKGVDAGNAIFAGTAAINGDTAMGRGMKPLNKNEIKDYQTVAADVKSEYIAAETEDAKTTPFDINKQYSFLGSLARKLVPATSTTTASLSSALSTIPSLLSVAVKGITPDAKAVGVFNKERFSQCEDSGYDNLKDSKNGPNKIDADVFCNVRYGLSATELAMNTDKVIDYMLNNGYVDELGTPQNDYADFVKNCVNRTAGWGEDQEGGTNGKECLTDSTKYSNFRVFTMDNSINQAMDYDGATSGGLSVMTFNILGEEQGKRNNNDGGFSMEKRANAAIAIIQEKQPAIIGLQEVNDSQFNYIIPKLTGYESAPGTSKGPSQPESILWNSSAFTKVDSGTYTYPKNQAISTAVWVKLQSISGGGSMYVFNTHPTSQSGSYGPSERKRATNIMLDEIKKVNTDNSPVVITGDFNSTTYLRDGKDTGASVSDLPSSIIKAAGYTDTHDIATEKINDDYKSSHVDAGVPRTKDNRSDKENKIDHVFVSSGITVTTWENVIDDNSVIASDHTPIIASLNVPGISAVGGAGDTGAAQTGSNIQGDDYKAECRPGYKGVGYINCRGQCVDFVLFRLAKHGIKYNAGGANGKDIARKLGTMGYTVNTKPAVNSVMSTSATSHPSLGHTAMVSKVNSDGSIVVEEYNFANPLHYGQRLISAAKIKADGMTFAHTESAYK